MLSRDRLISRQASAAMVADRIGLPALALFAGHTHTKPPRTMPRETTRDLIEAARQLENDHHGLAEQMIGFLEQHNGKKLTRRILPKLAELIGQDVILNDFTAGLLYLETDAYRRDRDGRCGPGAIKLLIPTAMGQTTLPEIDTEQIRERNACYLSAAIERNEKRESILASDLPEQIDRAGETYRQAMADLISLADAAGPDRFSVERAQELKKYK